MHFDKELGDKALVHVWFGLVKFIAPQTNALLLCDDSASQLSCRVFSMDQVAAKGIVFTDTSVINLAIFFFFFLITNWSWNFIDIHAFLEPRRSHFFTFKSSEHR